MPHIPPQTPENDQQRYSTPSPMMEQGTPADETAALPRSGLSLGRVIAVIVLIALIVFLATRIFGCGAKQHVLSPDRSTVSQAAYETTGVENPALPTADLRERFVDTANAKSATVMVYMVGSDLETYSAAASQDIQEMVNAQLGDNVRIVLETGGAKKWYFTDMASSRTRQRWEINSEGMYLLGEAGTGSMLDAKNVTDFATWAAQNYPADRYEFIFWDHGGGTLGGFGNDELYPRTSPLSLLDIRTALADTGLKFDIVGFDACLMGTIETAYALEPVADYMIASEEYEMGEGWAWTGFLTALGKDPSIDPVKLATVAIDDFTDYYYRKRQTNITLSLVDLREVPRVYEQMGEFLTAAEQTISADNRRFIEMSQARSKARSFADGSIDQVDVIDLIERTSFEGKDELLAAVRSCVKYRCRSSITGANGLAMYFPYSEVRMYQGTRAVLNNLGYVKPTEFYDYFLSIMGGSSGSSTGGLVDTSSAYGQQGSAGGSSSSSNTYADSTYSLEDWFESLLGWFTYQPVPDQLSFTFSEDYGGYIIPMTQDLWDVFSSFHVTVMEEYGNGYLMLGRDDVYDQTENNDIAVFYNYEWLTLGGQPVSFFSNEPSEEANGEYSHSGVIPAMLNDKTPIQIVVYWPVQSQQGATYTGYVQGYRLSENANNTYGRGLQEFTPGDVITPLFDVYDKQGKYSETIPGTAIKVTEANMPVTYELYDHATVHYWGTMVTVYGDQIDTQVLSF